MAGENLEKAKKLTIDSTEKEIFEAVDDLVAITRHLEEINDAWKKVSLILQWRQHRQMASLTKWLTIGTWVLVLATMALVIVALLVSPSGQKTGQPDPVPTVEITQEP